MSTETRVYNGDEVSIIFGPVIITGFADGEFLRVEQETDDFDSVAGTDGEVAVSKTNDRRGTVTIMLLQTTLANQLLSDLRNAGLTVPNSLVAFNPLLIRDNTGTTLYTEESAYIGKAPDASFDRTAQPREWMIKCPHLVRVDGTNNLAGLI